MSKAADVATAVETAVTAISALTLAGFAVKRRKLPMLPDGENPPQVVVSVAEEGDAVPFEFENRVFVSYPVAVTLVTVGGKAMADDDTMRGYRESIRLAIDKPSIFAAVTGFHSVRSSGLVPFDAAALKQDYNFSVQVFTVGCIESRN